MKMRILFVLGLLLAACLLVFGVSTPQKSTSEDWLTALIKQGPEISNFSVGDSKYQIKVFEQKTRHLPRHGLVMCSLSIPANKCRIVVRSILKAAPSSQIYEGITEASEIASLNGGYYGYGTKDVFIPLGLVISEGKVLNQKRKWSTGGVLMQKDAIQILPIASVAETAGIQQAVQSKPMLVRNGKLEIRSDSPEIHNRTAVGLNKKGDVIVAGAFARDGKAVSLYDFARFLMVAESEGGGEAEIALAMDGGPSSHLYIPALAKHFGYSGLNFVPNTVHFLPRS